MPAIAPIEDLRAVQEGFRDEFLVGTTYDLHLAIGD